MADSVKRVTYCYVTVPNRPGQGARVLGAIREAGVNLLAYSGFPAGGGKAQLDFVIDRTGPLRRLAKAQGWRLSRPKTGFLIRGEDRVGAVHHHLTRLAAAGVNVTAADAVSAGGGRYGMILWVKGKDVRRATSALGAR